MLKALRDLGGYSVFCAVEHEDWIIANNIPPEVGVEKDLAEIELSDIVLALLPIGLVSAGLQYEIGFADAKGKKVVMATETTSELAYFNQGSVGLGRTAHVVYDSPEALVNNLQRVLGTGERQ